MAIGNPTQVGTNTSQVATHTSIAAAGCVIPTNSLAVAVVLSSLTTTVPADTITVSDGTNTYAKDCSNSNTTAMRVSVFSFYYTAGGTFTVTATIPSSNMSWIYVYTVANAAASGAFDQKGVSSTTNQTTMAVTTAGNAAQADEVAFGIYGRGADVTNPTTWPGAGYTMLTPAPNADCNTTRSRGLSIEYKNGVTAGATVTADGTLAAASGIVRNVVTYKGAAFTRKPRQTLAPSQAVVRAAIR